MNDQETTIKKDDLLESLTKLKDKKKRGELENHQQTIDIIIPKKRTVQLSNKVTEETYKNLVWMAKKNEQTISLILEKAIAEYKKNHFDNPIAN